MLLPLTQELRFPFIEELVKSYGPYLERLAKDDKYGLIGCLSLWLQLEAEEAFLLGSVHVTEESLESLLSDYPASKAVQEILRKYLSQLNEPIIQTLITSLIHQIREGYYRRREIDELDHIGVPMESYCDLPPHSSFTDEDITSSNFEEN